MRRVTRTIAGRRRGHSLLRHDDGMLKSVRFAD